MVVGALILKKGQQCRAARQNQQQTVLEHKKILPADKKAFRFGPDLGMLYAMTTLALSEVLGAPVYDPSGAAGGRVREVALAPGEDRSRVAALIVKTKKGNRRLPVTVVGAINGGIRTTTGAGQWAEADGTEGFFLLERA